MNLLKTARLIVFKVLKNKFVRGALGILIIVTVIFFLRSDFAKVEKFKCSTQYGPTCDAKDLATLEKVIGSNFFTLDTKNLNNELSANFLNQQSYVQKVIPQKLNVFIIKRKPVVGAKIADKETPGYFLVDKDGVVVGFSENSSLPVLNYSSVEHTLVVGKTTDGSFKEAVWLLNSLAKNFNVQVGALVGESLNALLPESIKVVCPLNKETSVLSGSLQLILARSKMEGKLPRVIDLRYKNPVLTY